MAGIYIHIPFCAKRCGYCDFFSSTERGLMPAVLAQIEQELVRERGWLGGQAVQTIYFGGGTPSLVEPERLQRIINITKTFRGCLNFPAEAIAPLFLTPFSARTEEQWGSIVTRGGGKMGQKEQARARAGNFKQPLNLERVCHSERSEESGSSLHRSQILRFAQNDRFAQDDATPSEITMEANPDDLTPEYLEKLAKTDINRLSIGIQSFIDRDLRLMGRRHDAEAAKQAVREAQRKGFKNISIDLIFGIPGMTLDEWRGNLQQALELGVQHISAYHLTLEAGTPMSRLAPVDETASEEQFALLHDTLTGAGFEHYEISNFAKIRALHNANYWNGTPYLGVGAGAHSYTNGKRRHFEGGLKDYAEGRINYNMENLTEKDRHNELVMTRLRTAEGIADTLITPPARLLDSGLLIHDNGFYRIPPEKFLLSDMVIAQLFH